MSDLREEIANLAELHPCPVDEIIAKVLEHYFSDEPGAKRAFDLLVNIKRKNERAKTIERVLEAIRSIAIQDGIESWNIDYHEAEQAIKGVGDE